MQELTFNLLSGAVALTGLSIVAFAALRGWQQWLALRRFELERFAPADGAVSHDAQPLPGTANRIELADLRERVRKLEAIAAGVDL